MRKVAIHTADEVPYSPDTTIPTPGIDTIAPELKNIEKEITTNPVVNEIEKEIVKNPTLSDIGNDSASMTASANLFRFIAAQYDMYRAQRPDGTTYFFHAESPSAAQKFVQPGDSLVEDVNKTSASYGDLPKGLVEKDDASLRKIINDAVGQFDIDDGWRAGRGMEGEDLISHINDMCNEFGLNVSDSGALVKHQTAAAPKKASAEDVYNDVEQACRSVDELLNSSDFTLSDAEQKALESFTSSGSTVMEIFDRLGI